MEVCKIPQMMFLTGLVASVQPQMPQRRSFKSRSTVVVGVHWHVSLWVVCVGGNANVDRRNHTSHPHPLQCCSRNLI